MSLHRPISCTYTFIHCIYPENPRIWQTVWASLLPQFLSLTVLHSPRPLEFSVYISTRPSASVRPFTSRRGLALMYLEIYMIYLEYKFPIVSDRGLGLSQERLPKPTRPCISHTVENGYSKLNYRLDLFEDLTFLNIHIGITPQLIRWFCTRLKCWPIFINCNLNADWDID